MMMKSGREMEDCKTGEEVERYRKGVVKMCFYVYMLLFLTQLNCFVHTKQIKGKGSGCQSEVRWSI